MAGDRCVRQRLWPRAVVALAVAMLASAIGEAAEVRNLAPDLPDAERKDVGRIEAYLNGIDTLQARFLQVSSQGGTAEGSVYLSRPGRMRIEYDPPVPVLIVADDGWLIYYDSELEQVSHLRLSATPAAILVSGDISLFSDELAVTAFERGAGVLRVTVTRADEPLEGALTLVFTDRPLALKQWTVVDAQGIATTVSLIGTRFGMALDDELFHFRKPPDDDR